MQGSCLCKKVTIQTEEITPVTACHCTTCTTWSGGPLFSLFAQDIQIEGAAHVKEYSSSAAAVRGFCQECGTHLYMKGTEGMYGLNAGLFEKQAFVPVADEYYVSSKPSYYTLAEVSNRFDTY